MQLLRCLPAFICTTDIARAQKSPRQDQGPLSCVLHTTENPERSTDKENKRTNPNLIILTQPSVS